MFIKQYNIKDYYIRFEYYTGGWEPLFEFKYTIGAIYLHIYNFKFSFFKAHYFGKRVYAMRFYGY